MTAIVLDVPDPRLYCGNTDLVCGVVGYEDALRYTIEPVPSLPRCQMEMSLETVPAVTAGKRITAWEPMSSSQISTIETDATNHGPVHMVLDRSDGAEVHLQKWGWSRWMDMYTFDLDLMWACWGGRRVTMTWVYDWYVSPQPIPPPWLFDYPLVASPDSLISGPEQRVVFQAIGKRHSAISERSPLEVTAPLPSVYRFESFETPTYVVLGGAKFRIDDEPERDWVAANGLTVTTPTALSSADLQALPDAPVDFTFLTAFDAPASRLRSFVVYGGAKFEWTDQPGFRSSVPLPARYHQKGSIYVVPLRHIAGIPSIPRDGTLLREVNHPAIYVVTGGALFQIPDVPTFQDMCFDWRNVRIVPDHSTDALPKQLVAPSE